MKPILYAALLTSVTTLMPLMADKASEKPSSPTIAIVKQAILEKSSAFKDIAKQLEGERARVQKSLLEDEKKLKKEGEDLEAAQKKLSEEEFKKKRQAFEKQATDLRVKLELQKIRLELALDEAKKKMFKAFSEIVDALGQKRGGIILYGEAVATAEASYDLSDEVLKELNKKLPTIKVTFKSDAEIRKLISQQQAANN